MSAVPTPYQRQFDFTTFAANNPDTPPPAVQLDAEFNAVSSSVGQIIARLAQVQRDDGDLANGVVSLDSMSADVLALFTAIGGAVRGAWLTATAYAVKDIVTFGGGTYIAAENNTSGVFADDYTAGKWVALFNPTKVGDTAGDFSTLVPDFTGQLGIETDTGDIWISYGTSAGNWELINNGLTYANDAYVIVKTSASATANGTALLAAYAQAKALTPQGSAISVTNRSCVVIPPGTYDLGSSQLVLDTQYVDVIGQTTHRGNQRIISSTATSNQGVINQTANDVWIRNISLKNNCADNAAFNNTTSADYFCSSALDQTKMRNVEFLSANGVNGPYPMRISISYPGYFEECQALGGSSWGGGIGDITLAGVAGGTYIRCVGGQYAFGGSNGCSFTGTAIDCQGGAYAFGGYHGAIGSAALLLSCRKTGGFFDFSLVPTAGARLYNCVDDTGSIFFPVTPVASGSSIQKVYAESTANTDLIVGIPTDDTIPQSTEGTEVLSLAIVPKYTDSYLIVTFSGFISAGQDAVAALFRDAGTAAIAAAACTPYSTNHPSQIAISFRTTSGSIASTTFRVRAGTSTTAPLRFNGTTAGRWFGGSARATLTIEEIKA